MLSSEGLAIKDGVMIDDALRGIVDWLEALERDKSHSVV
jgi:hypothetical protein